MVPSKQNGTDVDSSELKKRVITELIGVCFSLFFVSFFAWFSISCAHFYSIFLCFIQRYTFSLSRILCLHLSVVKTQILHNFAEASQCCNSCQTSIVFGLHEHFEILWCQRWGTFIPTKTRFKSTKSRRSSPVVSHCAIWWWGTAHWSSAKCARKKR